MLLKTTTTSFPSLKMYKKKKSREEISSSLIIAKDLSTRSNTSRLQICWGQCTALLLVKQYNLRESSGQGFERLPGIPQLGGVSNILLKLTSPSRGAKETLYSQAIPISPSGLAVLRAQSRPLVQSVLRISRNIPNRCTEQKSHKRHHLSSNENNFSSKWWHTQKGKGKWNWL